MGFAILACVLAIVVPLGVAVALRISLARSCTQLAGELDDLRHSLKSSEEARTRTISSLAKLYEESSPARLKAAVDDLRADLDAERAAVHRRFGKIWGTLGREGLTGDDKPAQTLPRLPGWQS